MTKSSNIAIPKKLTLNCSNHEGIPIEQIQKEYRNIDGIFINLGAYTNTSIAILDAVKSVNIPTVEVHISKVKECEDFHQISYIRLILKQSQLMIQTYSLKQ